jgi:hypothetical protein
MSIIIKFSLFSTVSTNSVFQAQGAQAKKIIDKELLSSLYFSNHLLSNSLIKNSANSLAHSIELLNFCFIIIIL